LLRLLLPLEKQVRPSLRLTSPVAGSCQSLPWPH